MISIGIAELVIVGVLGLVLIAAIGVIIYFILKKQQQPPSD